MYHLHCRGILKKVPSTEGQK